MNGNIFNIQPYSIHDGPGIRTTIFFKGCPLRCLWCQNPESQHIHPQLMYYCDLCTGCERCITACPAAAIAQHDGKVATNRALCTSCGVCASVCSVRAREISGKTMDAIEAAEQACRDKLFFETSGGGVTLSGGEILAQPAFAVEILKRCKEKGVHTAIETTGFARWETLASVLEYTDLVLYDFKHLDSDKHKRLTGVDNHLILENARRLVHVLHRPLIGRIPLIPGLNDDDANLLATARFISQELGRDTKVHILPYNPLGESKNSSLEQSEYLQLKRQSNEALDRMRMLMLSFLDHVVIGG